MSGSVAIAHQPAGAPPPLPPKDSAKVVKVKAPEFSLFELAFNPNSVSVTTAKQFDFRDKLVKLVAYIFEALNALLKVAPGVSPDVQKSWHVMTDYTKAARMVFGFLNAFAGGITGISWGAINMNRVCRQEKTTVYNAVLKDNRVYDGVQGGIIERILGFVIECGYFIGAFTYTVAFAIFAPIRFFEKCGFKIAQSAKAAGNIFPYFMCANHFAVGIANICDFIHLGMTYKRETDPEKRQNYFDNYLPRLVCNFGEKICETIVDFVTTIGYKAPGAVRYIACGLGGSFGFYRVYREVKGNGPVADPEKRIKTWADVRNEFSAPSTSGTTGTAPAP